MQRLRSIARPGRPPPDAHDTHDAHDARDAKRAEHAESKEMAWTVLDQPRFQTHVRDPLRYKTVLCRTFLRQGSCPYEEKCQYAHGPAELRTTPHWTVLPPPTGSVCRYFLAGEVCRYGRFCKYPHTFDGLWTSAPVPVLPPLPPVPPVPALSELCKPCGYGTASPRTSNTVSSNSSSSSSSNTSACDDDDRRLEQQLELVLSDWEFVDLDER